MKKIFGIVMTCILLVGLATPITAANITHGTADQLITEDMLNNTPPADYAIGSATQADAREGKYNAWFPKDQLQEVHIDIEENNLNYLLQNAVDEPYVMTTSVSIGSTTLGYCGLRTKGNFTLYHSYHDNPGSDRFSFTVNFGKYITKDAYGEKQNFYGCEKISFNNFFFDKSMMKEFFALMLMEEMGLPTPQFCLAKLYINDEYYGVYFMLEALDETILEQHWNLDSKDISEYLCKPTGTNLNYWDLQEDDAPLWEHDEDTRADVESMLPTVMEWTKKLNYLSKGKNFDNEPIDVQSQEYVDLLSSIYDLEEVIKYFAVASWLCQTDNMFTNFQNYGLYISREGVATLLPWDYDLAFGCYYPSTAETTANYPIDVMYRLDLWQYENEEKISSNLYKDFPLFNVIYQNDHLMELYHSYMAECSQIAALGGTVESTGRSYDPGYFNSYIEVLSESLLAAATEKTADHVYYMNHIQQPKGVEDALPNLSRIIAQRSVGVWSQVHGIETTVCGAGCNLETLGNALTGEFTNNGNLTIVDSTTGIFAQATFKGDRRAAAPVLTVTELEAGNETYEAVKAAIPSGRKDTLLVYEGRVSSRTVSSDYTVTIPLAQEHLIEEAEYQFYSYNKGQLTAIEMTRDGNLFTGTVTDLNHIVVQVTPESQPLLPILLIAGGVLLLAGGVLILLHIRKKKTSGA